MRVNTGHRSVGGVSLSNCVSVWLWKYTTPVHSGKISITKGGAIASRYVFERQPSATGNKQLHRKMNLLTSNKNVPCNIYMWRLRANWRHLYLSPSSNCVFEPRQIQSAPQWLAQPPKHSLLIRKSKKKSFLTFFHQVESTPRCPSPSLQWKCPPSCSQQEAYPWPSPRRRLWHNSSRACFRVSHDEDDKSTVAGEGRLKK